MSLDELTIKSLALENGCPILLPIPFKLSIAPKIPCTRLYQDFLYALIN